LRTLTRDASPDGTVEGRRAGHSTLSMKYVLCPRRNCGYMPHAPRKDRNGAVPQAHGHVVLRQGLRAKRSAILLARFISPAARDAAHHIPATNAGAEFAAPVLIASSSQAPSPGTGFVPFRRFRASHAAPSAHPNMAVIGLRSAASGHDTQEMESQ
jgi:hypothetical protein